MYLYGFEVLISSIIYTTVFILVSIITKTIFPSLCFFIGFYLIRSISGGFHANTYTACHILYFANHIAFIVIIKLTPSCAANIVTSTLLIISSALILIFAPADHPNKPFIKNEKKRFRLLSTLYGILLIFISAFPFFITSKLILNTLQFISIGSISAAISLTVARIQNERRKRHEEV